MGKLFGTDGIRGVANVYPMDAPTALAVGRAVAVHFAPRGTASRGLVVIGQDTRLSGDMLAHAAAAGACAAGLDVALTGVLPTPGIARLTAANGACAGLVISASHNPYEDNGIKVFDGKGCKLSDDTERRLEALVMDGHGGGRITSRAIGRVGNLPDAGGQYLDFLLDAADGLSLDTMTLVLDCANGAAYQVAPELFRRLGAHVIPMFCAPDGTNINDGCGSQHPGHLARGVVSAGADAGLAFDGDGDRLIAVDESGKVLTGDQVLAVCARDWQRRGLLANNAVVTTVMSNMGFHLALRQMGITVHTTRVGDRYVMEKMLAEGALLGGEDSGHMIFRDVHTTGDGLVAALRLLGAVRGAGRPLSELAAIMTVYPQELINVDVKDKPELTDVPEVAAAVARVEKALGNRGRVLLRYSGTQNLCRVMVEGPSKEQTKDFCREIADVVKKTIG
jgi:phosphoglucosamine mutase